MAGPYDFVNDAANYISSVPNKVINLFKPSDAPGDYTTRAAAIARQQKLAEALSQMGAQEQAVYTAGGITAPVSPMGALARGLTSFGGSYLAGKASADEAALKKAQETDTSNTIAEAIKAGGPQYKLDPVDRSALPDIPGAATSTGGITPMPAGVSAAPPSSYDANAEMAAMPSASAAPRQQLSNGYTGVSGQSYTAGSPEEAARILSASKNPSLRDKGLEMIFGKREKMGPGEQLQDFFGNAIGSRVPMVPKTPNYSNNPEEDFIIQTGVDGNGNPYQYKINKADIPMFGSTPPPSITNPLEAKNYPNNPTVLVDGQPRTNPYYRGQ